MEKYKIVEKSSLIVMGIECRTSNAPDAGPHDIPKHWEKFYAENTISRIPNKLSHEVIGLYCDYEGDYTKPYSLVIGCPVSSVGIIPAGMVAKTIPASKFAHFRAVGEYPKSLIDSWVEIWQTNLNRTYTGDYELYGEKFAHITPKQVDLFIAVA